MQGSVSLPVSSYQLIDPIFCVSGVIILLLPFQSAPCRLATFGVSGLPITTLIQVVRKKVILTIPAMCPDNKGVINVSIQYFGFQVLPLVQSTPCRDWLQSDKQDFPWRLWIHLLVKVISRHLSRLQKFHQRIDTILWVSGITS